MPTSWQRLQTNFFNTIEPDKRPNIIFILTDQQSNPDNVPAVAW